MAENASSGKASKSKAAMVFMQKYHHKGAFFMENDESNRVRPDPKPWRNRGSALALRRAPSSAS
jgi:hypothetical protein